MEMSWRWGGAGDGEKLEMARSWRWVAGDGNEWKIGNELKVGRNWR